MLVLIIYIFSILYASVGVAASTCPIKVGFPEEIAAAASLKNEIKDLFKQINCDVNIVVLPGRRILRKLERGELDGDAIRFRSIEAHYSFPFVRTQNPIIHNIRLGIWASAEKPNTLPVGPIGYISGTQWHRDYLSSKSANTKTARFLNLEQMLSAYNNGRISHFLSSSLVMKHIMNAPTDKNKPIEISVIQKQNAYLYLNRKFTHIVNKIDEFIKTPIYRDNLQTTYQ
ncbi:MAG: hypothetical protein R3261_00900 [Alphaproteobacteria bacterium]|nr:hypothetical protein [Alphaproteobacteria bacterium]